MELIGPIKAVSVVYGLIVNLLSIQERRRKVLFDEFLKPTFESFQDVHEFYRSIFLKLRDGIDRFVEPSQELGEEKRDMLNFRPNLARQIDRS